MTTKRGNFGSDASVVCHDCGWGSVGVHAYQTLVLHVKWCSLLYICQIYLNTVLKIYGKQEKPKEETISNEETSSIILKSSPANQGGE